MTTKKPSAASTAKKPVKVSHSNSATEQTLKPTKWGADLLVKMDAFRLALNAKK